MGHSVRAIIFVLFAATTALTEEMNYHVERIELDHSTGIGYEIIQTKLEMLEFRFTELFVQLKEQGEAFLNNQRRVEDEQRELNRIVDRHERKITNLIFDLEDSFGTNVTRISDQSRQILELQTICANHDSIRSQLFELHLKDASSRSEKLTAVVSTDREDCIEKSGQISGLCRMRIGSEDVTVYREQVRFGGNWIVVMQRYDGSVPFDRSWAEYRDGFGTVGQEFWIGLERLHLLTKDSRHELAVELEDFEGNYRYARYDQFSVGPEDEQYPLSELGAYAGTAGDSLRNHAGAMFSTIDKDHFECSNSWGQGGGWYIDSENCYDVHLMGEWQNIESWKSIIWQLFAMKEQTPIQFVRMMVRKF